MFKYLHLSLLLYFSLIASNILHAQNNNIYKVERSEERKIDKERHLMYIEEEELKGFSVDSSENVYLLKSLPSSKKKSSDLVLETYSKDMRFLGFKDVVLTPKVNEEIEIQNFYAIGKKPIIFYSNFDSKAKSKSLYYSQLSPLCGIVANKKLLTFEVNRAYKGKFDIVLSADSSKFMVVYKPFQYDAKNLEVQCFVFSRNLDLIKKYNLKFDHAKIDIYDQWQLTNIGYPLCFIEYPRKKKNAKFGKEVVELQLYIEDKPLVFNLDFENKKIQMLKLVTDNEREIILLGMFGHLRLAETCGTVFLKIDLQTKKVVSSKLNIFSKEILDYHELKLEKVKEKSAGIEFYRVNKISKTAQNNPFIVLEFYNEVVFAGKDFSSTDIYGGDKILVKYNNKGEVIFERIISTLASSTSVIRGVNSFTFVNGEIIGIVYNTHIANLRLKQGEKRKEIPFQKGVFSKLDKCVTVASSFDEKGVGARSVIFEYEKDHLYLDHGEIFYGDNFFIIPGTDGKKYSIAKATLSNVSK